MLRGAGPYVSPAGLIPSRSYRDWWHGQCIHQSSRQRLRPAAEVRAALRQRDDVDARAGAGRIAAGPEPVARLDEDDERLGRGHVGREPVGNGQPGFAASMSASVPTRTRSAGNRRPRPQEPERAREPLGEPRNTPAPSDRRSSSRRETPMPSRATAMPSGALTSHSRRVDISPIDIRLGEPAVKWRTSPGAVSGAGMPGYNRRDVHQRLGPRRLTPRPRERDRRARDRRAARRAALGRGAVHVHARRRAPVPHAADADRGALVDGARRGAS